MSVLIRFVVCDLESRLSGRSLEIISTMSNIPDDELPESTAGYVAPKQVAVSELMKTDAEDESLARYKQALIASQEAVFPEDPRSLIVTKLAIVFEDHDPIELDLTLPNQKRKIVMKEGVNYVTKLYFYVQREIVSCLTYMNFVYNKIGLRLVKDQIAIGSYGPSDKEHEVIVEEGTTPSGMLGRGTYNAKARLLDDDLKVHLELEYTFEIKKNWE